MPRLHPHRPLTLDQALRLARPAQPEPPPDLVDRILHRVHATSSPRTTRGPVWALVVLNLFSLGMSGLSMFYTPDAPWYWVLYTRFTYWLSILYHIVHFSMDVLKSAWPWFLALLAVLVLGRYARHWAGTWTGRVRRLLWARG
ncbi:MAG: hypothetical protein GXO36_05000 [Chloroflexi bacterium]|nr:hypothetical protein [Chloroflexota bacterium]